MQLRGLSPVFREYPKRVARPPAVRRSALPAMRQAELLALQRSASRACVMLKALANEVRLILICQLAEGEKSVSQLQAAVGLGQSAVSQHLALLRHRRLVATRRDRRSVYYRIAQPEVRALIRTMHDQFCRAAREGRARGSRAG